MPDKDRFGKSYKSYEPRTRKERNIYNESLRRAQEAQQQGRTPGKYLKGQIAKHGWTDPSKASFTGSLPNLRQTFKPVTAMFADFLGQGLGSFMESEKARVGGKFNAPLNIQPRTYKWLSNNVIKDEYEDEFERDVADNSLYWTGLNKYAKDKYIGGGQLARGINARNEGIIGSDAGAEALADAYRAQADEIGEGPIGNALANYGVSRDKSAESLEDLLTTQERFPGLTTNPKVLENLNKVGYFDRYDTGDSVFPDDYTITTDTPFESWADEPQNIRTSEDLVASEPYTWSALDMYPNLNIPVIKNKYFPNTAIEDITRDDIRGLNQFDLFDLGYAG